MLLLKKVKQLVEGNVRKYHPANLSRHPQHISLTTKASSHLQTFCCWRIQKWNKRLRKMWRSDDTHQTCPQTAGWRAKQILSCQLSAAPVSPTPWPHLGKCESSVYHLVSWLPQQFTPGTIYIQKFRVLKDGMKKKSFYIMKIFNAWNKLARPIKLCPGRKHKCALSLFLPKAKLILWVDSWLSKVFICSKFLEALVLSRFISRLQTFWDFNNSQKLKRLWETFLELQVSLRDCCFILCD